MAEPPTVYTDDSDASWTFTITSRDSTVVDWATPKVAIGSAGYIVDVTFLGAPATTRTVRVPLVGLTAGLYSLYLKVPGGTDLLLGQVRVKART